LEGMAQFKQGLDDCGPSLDREVEINLARRPSEAIWHRRQSMAMLSGALFPVSLSL
jgi:hypothetical protein